MTTEFHGEEEILGKAYDAHLMARILRYLRPSEPACPGGGS